ncbi:Early endosome antigen 1 [Lasiodiplodia hormozganensis]|uniref:Early endosome antigen 1 n=1 Tax=Lasiodiplodia hormozganensis TaxID=869390 RepID=A0AA39XW01_9PEZI|nr:Early endosome antigen 1 [Lasiodiplodia hormozganensis]
MTWAEAHKAEAFVDRLRDEAVEGAKHFANLPHHAGSTKTALALTILAYTAGKRDGLKPRATELAAINKDLSWTKHELAKRDIEQEDVVKRLRLDLRWANIQVAKKDEKLQALKEELDTERKSRQQIKEHEAMSADGFNGTTKADESQMHTVATENDDMRSLREQLEHERREKEYYKELYENLSRTSTPDGHLSSESLQAKVGALQETIDGIEEGFKKTCSHLQTKLLQAEQHVRDMKERLERQAHDHNVQLVQAQQRTLEEKERFKALANSRNVQLVNTQKRTAVYQAEIHRLTREKSELSEEMNKQIAQLKQSQQSQNGCPSDHQRSLEDRIKFLLQEKELQHQDWQKKLWKAQNKNGASTESANSSQVTNTPSIHLQSIQKLEDKLAVIESKANKNEQNLKKKVQELEDKLAQLGPLERFLEDRDFSDEKRLHLTWDDMTYAVRAAAAGLSPQTRRTLGHGHSTYIVEEALRHGSRDLVSFALDSPGRFVLRFKFFEAVESIVDNILWEAQKFPSVRKMLKEDSTNVKMALVRHASK